MRTIWVNIKDYWAYCETMIELPQFTSLPGEDHLFGDIDDDESYPSCAFLSQTPLSINFPPPTDININMMPFIVGDSFQTSKLPEYIKPYWPMIQSCLKPETARARWHMWPRRDFPSELGKVNYLTIQESWVEEGTSQRRPGLHVDSPGAVKIKDQIVDGCLKGKGSSQPYKGHRWGGGCAHEVLERRNDDDEPDLGLLVCRGGIYIASSVSSSCRAWNCAVKQEVVGRLGDIEHMRGALLQYPGLELEAGKMYWITDRTPHESLALPEGTFRQFFRLVTSQVSFWYKDHSTENPRGVKPDTTITKVVVGDKFGDEGVEVLDNDQVEVVSNEEEKSHDKRRAK